MALFIPKDRKSLFRQFLAGMYDAVVITDPNGHVLEVNPRAIEYFGYEQDEVVDQPISIFIPGLTSEIVQRIRRGMEDDRHVMIDANARSKAGTKIACEVAISAIDLMDPGDLIFTIRNVERRRKIMNEFRSKANAFQLSPVALFVCDTEGRMRDANNAFFELFGIEGGFDELQQHVFSDYLPDDPLPENFKRALAGEQTVIDIVAEGEEDEEEVEVTLAPNRQGRKIDGVVGSIKKV